MADPVPIELISGCTPPAAPGTIRLPKETKTLDVPRVLVEAGGKSRVLLVDYRADGGDGACLTAADHRALDKAGKGTYRPLKTFEALRKDSGLRAAAFTALATLASTLLAAYLAYDKTTAPDETTGAGPSQGELITALVVAALAFYLAVTKFRKDWKGT
jgi:hypothetical protein